MHSIPIIIWYEICLGKTLKSNVDSGTHVRNVILHHHIQITMKSAAYFIPGQQPPECKLVAQTSSQESQFEYRLKLKGLQMPLSILLCIPIQTTTSTQG